MAKTWILKYIHENCFEEWGHTFLREELCYWFSKLKRMNLGSKFKIEAHPGNFESSRDCYGGQEVAVVLVVVGTRL